MIAFRPLATEEREQLFKALRGNAEQGHALLTDPRDTTFRRAATPDEVTDAEVITAIRSVPTHYADDRTVHLAKEMLRACPGYMDDARQGAPIGNSVVGSLLSLQHQIPRQYAEPAVVEALRQLDKAKHAEQEEFILPRTGQAPLKFTGKLLVQGESMQRGTYRENRWHEVAIYLTAAGKYVVAIAYNTRWEGEQNVTTATVCATTEAVRNALAEYDPTQHVHSHPNSPTYEVKRRRLEDDLRVGYGNLASNLLYELGKDFAEAVE